MYIRSKSPSSTIVDFKRGGPENLIEPLYIPQWQKIDRLWCIPGNLWFVRFGPSLWNRPLAASNESKGFLLVGLESWGSLASSLRKNWTGVRLDPHLVCWLLLTCQPWACELCKNLRWAGAKGPLRAGGGDWRENADDISKSKLNKCNLYSSMYILDQAAALSRKWGVLPGSLGAMAYVHCSGAVIFVLGSRGATKNGVSNPHMPHLRFTRGWNSPNEGGGCRSWE